MQTDQVDRNPDALASAAKAISMPMDLAGIFRRLRETLPKSRANSADAKFDSAAGPLLSTVSLFSTASILW